MSCRPPSGGCCGNSRAWPGSRAASGGVHLSTHPCPVPGPAAAPQCLRVTLCPHRPHQLPPPELSPPQSLEHPMLFAFRPDLGAFRDASSIPTSAPSCSWGATRWVSLLQFLSARRPSLAFGCRLHFLPTVAWARPHHDPKPRLRPCDGPTQDFRVREASGRRCHHGGQRGDVLGARLL